ncbi:MAG: redoxin domain-containing protein [Bacteroidales bacterium]|nr:redoxin domain-containing protein [Bacteroidales bacterium]
MKKLIISALAVVAMASCNKSGIEVSGSIDNAEGQMIYLSQMNLDKTFIVDSAEIKADGSFSLNAPKTKEPTFFLTQLSDKKKQITILADSLTESINFTADAQAANWTSSIKFTNSEESQALADLISRVDEIQSNLVSIASDKTLTEEQKQTSSAELLKKIDEHKTYVTSLIFDKPRSFVSYFALFQTVIDMPVFDIMSKDDIVLFNTVATSLRIAYPENDRVKHLCDYVLQIRAMQKQQQKTEALLKDATEVNSPDIFAADKDGNIHKLSDLKGKIVLLQFWGSQSEESRKLNRQLVKIYEKYHSKGLEIFQVSVDTSKLLWESAVESDKLTWTNVCDFYGVNSTAVRVYNITSIPSNYIIDRDGSLIGKDLVGTRLDNRMAELFK